mgnify:CR=1 FL=1
MNFPRKLFTLILTMILLIGCFSTQASATGSIMHGIGFVNTDSLRLRSDSTLNSKVVDTAPKNDCVVVISKHGDWYKVIYDLKEGYMHGDYLNVQTTGHAELGYGKVTGSAVNLRSGPSTTSRVVATAAKGAKCYIIGLNNGWYKVIYGSNLCYIRSDYLELTEIPYENRDSANKPKFFIPRQSNSQVFRVRKKSSTLIAVSVQSV